MQNSKPPSKPREVFLVRLRTFCLSLLIVSAPIAIPYGCTRMIFPSEPFSRLDPEEAQALLKISVRPTTAIRYNGRDFAVWVRFEIREDEINSLLQTCQLADAVIDAPTAHDVEAAVTLMNDIDNGPFLDPHLEMIGLAASELDGLNYRYLILAKSSQTKGMVSAFLTTNHLNAPATASTPRPASSPPGPF